MTRLLLDAGAFIALDRNDRAMWERLALARRSEAKLITHAGIVGQVWRRPSRQARLASALPSVDVRPLSNDLALATGLLLAATRTSDVLDGALAMLCRSGDTLLTSDPDDLTLLLGFRGLTDVGVIRV